MQDWGGAEREREQMEEERQSSHYERNIERNYAGASWQKKRGMHWKVKEEGVMKLETLLGMQQNADGAS